jgi:hypothetical protein
LERTLNFKFQTEIALPYLKTLYLTLLARNSSNSRTDEPNLSKIVFFDYIRLPGLLGESLFHSFTSNNDCRYINESEFTTGLFNLFSSNLTTKMLMTYKMYDFSGKGKITKEDVRVLMSYIPFKCFATSWGIDDSPR